MSSEIQEKKVVGTIHIVQLHDGGFVMEYVTPGLREGGLLKHDKRVEVVAETRESLVKKVQTAVEFMLKFFPEKKTIFQKTATMPGAADHEEPHD